MDQHKLTSFSSGRTNSTGFNFYCFISENLKGVVCIQLPPVKEPPFSTNTACSVNLSVFFGLLSRRGTFSNLATDCELDLGLYFV